MTSGRSWSWVVLVLGVLGCRSMDEAPVPLVGVAEPASRAPAGVAGAVGINPRLLRRFRQVAGMGENGGPLPKSELSALGRMLWYEPRLSGAGQLSCNSCHDLATYGVDHRPTSVGHQGQRGRRNAPTVFNAAGQFAQFWDGRANTLEEQASQPILNPLEMAASAESAEAALRSIPAYRALFQQAFPGEAQPVTLPNVARALAAFERGLVTRSRWDDYLAGDAGALEPDELQGLRVFLNVGCMACHTGPQVGASMFKVAGFVEAWPNQRDLGRYEVTGRSGDRMVFKVPTMKNVAVSGPYFHDGSCADLRQAVHLMGRHQLGIDLSDPEVGAIVAFLGALTGELPRSYIARPVLPQFANSEGTL